MHARPLLVVPVLAALALALGCSSSSGGGGTTDGGGGGGASGSCLISNDGGPTAICISPVHSALSESQFAQICTMEGAVKAPGSCPTANLLGCCTAKPVESCYYMASGVPATQLQSSCTMGGSSAGTWSTTP
jgi:hypothetical protein